VVKEEDITKFNHTLDSPSPGNGGVSFEHVWVEFDAGEGAAPSEAGTSKRTVIRDVTLTVQNGEFVALVGKSGCGKTTLLNLVSGLVSPARGSITVCGKNPKEARNDIAYMFARDCLLPWRTIQKNAELALENRGVTRRERHDRARAELLRVGLQGYERRYPAELSQGMRQRAALARTWTLDPRVLLMDEPFAALDAQTREQLEVEFLSIWENKRCTVLFVTHDLTESLFMADRVVMIDHGTIGYEMKLDFPRPRQFSELTTSEDFRVALKALRAALSSENSNSYDDGNRTGSEIDTKS
jgi:NitT/TauT family transport system ATP-binding protein